MMVLSERRSHIVDEAENGIRLDSLLGAFPAIRSRSAAVKLIESGLVEVNGSLVSKKYAVCENDIIRYEVQDRTKGLPIAEYIPLDIRFEDEYLLVLSKQADFCCHPSPGHETGTLVNALIAHCGADHLGTMQGDDRLGIVHRLDKDTSGLMLAAKDNETQSILQNAIRNKDIDRRYLTLVHGNIAPDTGLIDAPIARGRQERMKMEISDALNARSSVTTFKVLERFEAGHYDDGYTLLECSLHTGRTHQIRVHMDYIHHPCVGDPMYGARRAKAEHGLKRQFLHSYRLDFEHPVSHQFLHFLDPLPEDLTIVLKELASFSRGRTKAGEELFADLTSYQPAAEAL